MYFCEDLESFLEQLSTLQGKMFLISCVGLGIIGYVLYVFAWAVTPRLYGG